MCAAQYPEPTRLSNMDGYGPDEPSTQTFAFCDGDNGVLALNLAHPDIDLLADACLLIAHGPLPSGARTITVHLDSDVYMVTHHQPGTGEPEVEITNVIKPSNSLRLSVTLMEVLASMLQEAARQPRS